MTEYPEDIMKAARNLYMDLDNMRQPRAKDFEGAKTQAFNNGDKIDMIASAIFAERQRGANVAANEAERISENEQDYSGSRVHDMLVTARRIQAAISGDENIHLSDAVRARITNTSEVQA